MNATGDLTSSDVVHAADRHPSLDGRILLSADDRVELLLLDDIGQRGRHPRGERDHAFGRGRLVQAFDLAGFDDGQPDLVDLAFDDLGLSRHRNAPLNSGSPSWSSRSSV